MISIIIPLPPTKLIHKHWHHCRSMKINNLAGLWHFNNKTYSILVRVIQCVQWQRKGGCQCTGSHVLMITAPLRRCVNKSSCNYNAYSLSTRPSPKLWRRVFLKFWKPTQAVTGWIGCHCILLLSRRRIMLYHSQYTLHCYTITKHTLIPLSPFCVVWTG